MNRKIRKTLHRVRPLVKGAQHAIARDRVFNNSNDEVIASIVYEQKNEVHERLAPRPLLWKPSEGSKALISVFQPRVPSDFSEVPLLGQYPSRTEVDFKRSPRFGGTCISIWNGRIYVGSWNSVFVFDGSTLEFLHIVSHSFMQDIHGLHVDERGIFTVLTQEDTLVLTSHDGNEVVAFQIGTDLSVKPVDRMLNGPDWRFIGKQERGSTGNFHFNHIAVAKDVIQLTSRNLSCLISVNLSELTAVINPVAFNTPVLIHDGEYSGENFFLTSIDGQVIKCSPREIGGARCRSIDLGAILGRVPNWTRGLAISPDSEDMHVLIDGRYGTGGPAWVCLSGKDSLKMIAFQRLALSSISDDKEFSYTTGFDVAVISPSIPATSGQ